LEAVLTILGSGTSMGVPTLGCSCRVCTSPDPRDRRSRPSVTVSWEGHLVVIDTGPDFRCQALRENIRHIDAVLYTHSHADHILGLDDLRPLSFPHKDKLPLYADDATARIIEKVFDYTFDPTATYPHRARVSMNRFADGPHSAVDIHGLRFQRVPVLHGDLEIAGFRFGSAAYLTDMVDIPESSLPLLEDLDVLVLDALRPKPHPSHANLEQAAAWVERIRPRRAFFTHMSHEVHHADTERDLPPHIRLAYDGLRVPFEI
jgi:phosphoribosyl 1,2-cyclic phosphate phosphodiesterase